MDIKKQRRDLHQHPEVGFTEFRTASIVVKTLQSLGYKALYGEEAMDNEARKGVPADDVLQHAYQRALKDGADSNIVKRMKGGLTAVIGKLSGNRPGPTIAFRFDMDALPIQEAAENDHLPFQENFQSFNEGNMHACGHDAHTSIGLTLADAMKDGDFAGTLMLIFQPAEEGGRGASSIAARGVLNNVDKLYCMHLGLGVPQGEVCGGTYGWLATTKMAGRFYGVASHAGNAPEKGRNSLVGASTALLNIHGLPRYSGGKTRVNVGTLTGGSAPNIIPNKATMTIETRSEDEYINQDLENRVKQIIKHSAQMHDLDYETEIIGESTTMDCDQNLINTVVEEAKKIPSFTTVRRLCLGNGSEDASMLIKNVQAHGGEGTYMIIGTTIPAPHHHPKFDINEDTLSDAVTLLHRIAKRELT